MILVSVIVIFGFLALGELIVYITGIHFPASLIGMLLLTFSLHKKWIKLEWVKGISDVLVGNLGLFFIPPSISVMLYFKLIANNWVAITTAVVISTALVLFTTGKVYQFLRKSTKK